MSHNISLKYLFDQQNLNARQARWFPFLSEYEFEIKHIKWKENKVVDALSRHTSWLFVINYFESDLKGHVLNGGNSNKEYQSLKEKTA